MIFKNFLISAIGFVTLLVLVWCGAWAWSGAGNASAGIQLTETFQNPERQIFPQFQLENYSFIGQELQEEEVPKSVVMQYIEGQFYKWKEYERQGELEITLKEPEYRQLSSREAEALKEKSQRWQEELTAQVNPQVMGEDDREAVEDTTKTPWNTVGRLEAHFEIDDTSSEIVGGTAFLVTPHVALTNTHTVYDETKHQPPDYATFYPGRYEDGGVSIEPFGSRQTSEFKHNQDYIDDLPSPSLAEDYSAVLFEDPFEGIDVFMPLEFNYEPQETAVVGYPEIVDGAYNADMMKSWDEVLGIDGGLIYSANFSSHGNSGGPVIADDFGEKRAVGIVSAKETAYEDLQPVTSTLSVHLADNNRDKIEEWMEWEPDNGNGEDEEPGPEPDYDIERLYGEDRYETAVEISKEAYPDGSGAVVLARGDEFPDALAGAPLAMDRGGPLLLTRPGELPDSTAAEIDRLMPWGGTVYVLGGPAAVSEDVREELENKDYDVERVHGDNRYETAVEIAEKLYMEPGKVFLTTGEDFADAVSISSIAAMRGAPILLSEHDNLNDATSDYLDERGGELADVHVVGGPAALSDDVYSQAGATNRIYGENRWLTALSIAETFFQTPYQVNLATGEKFPDALSGGLYAALRGSPVLLSRPEEMPPEVENYIQTQPELDTLAIFGGESSIPDHTLHNLRD